MFLPRSLRAAVLAVGLLCAAGAASAQTDRGTITGQVTDQSTAIITGASVKAVHVATNFERQVTTSNEGSFTIPQLPVGGYVVIVTARNFQTTTLEFRFEAFNLLNRTIWGTPDSTITSANFGLVTGLANAPRQMQLGLRLEF